MAVFRCLVVVSVASLQAAVPSTAAFASPTSAAPVTSGLADLDDPAVVALVNKDDQLVCTGSLITPHTVLTAAHCTEGAPLTLRAFIGSSLFDGGSLIAVTDARRHPRFNPGGYDIAVLTIADAASPTPLALEPALDASLVDTSSRVVGFGLAGSSIGGAGVKRFGVARVISLTTDVFTVVSDPSLPCLGDSGGPALLMPAGTIAGVVSRVDSLCADHADYQRADIAIDSFIAPYLDETAPGAAQEGDPCFYAEHCAAGLECRGDAERFCEPADAGCGCRASAPSSALLVLVVFAFARRRRRSATA